MYYWNGCSRGLLCEDDEGTRTVESECGSEVISEGRLCLRMINTTEWG